MRIGLNLLVLTSRPPGGTGHHAISLFEALVVAEQGEAGTARITGFVEAAALRHFSEDARSRMVVLPPSRGWRRLANELVRLPQAARRAGIDLMVNPAFLGVPWGSRRRAVIIHDLYFRSVPQLVPWRRRMLLRVIVPLLGRCSDIIFSVSHTTKAELERAYPSLGGKVRVLYNGNRALSAPGTSTPCRPMRRSYLLMVGHLTANKHPETAVGALRILKRSGRDLALVHIGEDNGRLASLAVAADLTADVITLGRQPDHVLADYYAHCEALVIPSVREGFGLPLIEAQAQGAPVVASSCDALMEIGGSSALYFPVASADDCAAAILRLLDNPAERRAMIERGRVNAARFRWEYTAERLLELVGAGRSARGGQPLDQ